MEAVFLCGKIIAAKLTSPVLVHPFPRNLRALISRSLIIQFFRATQASFLKSAASVKKRAVSVKKALTSVKQGRTFTRERGKAGRAYLRVSARGKQPPAEEGIIPSGHYRILSVHVKI
ncbi:hypothetical protein SAMN04488126_12829 [Bhargavaea beijingensis]|uniref:Uncharacterized protein n=1 Tax=Bhargavaea beijingensis TaxID=426756 RepID=A0A1G7GQN1_9BACL|nr:hypothetical protein SAMN04488126_12829 [Bhargavaea beijingensis]